jgi:hypothetical protein
VAEKFLTTLLHGNRVLTSRTLAALLAPVLLLSCAQLVSSALERSGTLAHLVWAQRLSPLDHHPPLLLTELEPNRAGSHWERIRELHPFYAPAWIRLGLDHEMAGRRDDAERGLRHAATINQTFLPQWTLANFYFRQGREDLFWTHTRRAVSVYQGDLTGVFQLGLRVDDDPVRVWERLSPPYAPARMDLMRVLLANKRYGAAARVADLVASAHLRETREVLLNACDQSIGQGEVPAAIAFWNAAARNGWIARPTLDAANGSQLADGAFQHQPMGACFDWRLPPHDGVSFHAGAPAGLRIVMSGRQPSDTILANVRIPVEPRHRYRLSWRYTAELGPSSAPPLWRINGAVAAEWDPRAHNREDFIEFDSGSRRLIDLSLASSPGRGTTRPEGRLRLDWITITPISTASSPANHL